MLDDVSHLTKDPQTKGYAGQHNGVRYLINRAVTGWTLRVEGHGTTNNLNTVDAAVSEAKSTINNS